MKAGMLILAAIAGLSLPGAPAAAELGHLSLGSKHWAPSISSLTGAGTANAVAVARVTRQEIEGWCANWSPGDSGCAARELASPEAQETYRASADCTRGRITPVDGNTYTLAGRWDNSDIGGGRTRWRDAGGRIVGRDNASGGLGISQQWEVLCPEKASPPAARRAPAPPAAVPQAVPAPVARSQYAVGEVVYARYGPAWMRGRITKIRQVTGARGPELAYEVRLDNGERGVLPTHMMRKAP